MAKLFAFEEVFKVCRHAMELHGGNRVMLDFGIEKLLRASAVFLHIDGTTDISKFRIVKALFPDTARVYAGQAK
jgi:alkylation response protein AidB-like acyl-CoA dehydrogenase